MKNPVTARTATALVGTVMMLSGCFASSPPKPTAQPTAGVHLVEVVELSVDAFGHQRLPVAALLKERGPPHVWKMSPRSTCIKAQTVSIISTGQTSALASNLRGGDLIVVDPDDDLRDGMCVTIAVRR